VQLIDGIKFIFDDAWLLIRESGTEPAYKLYAEAGTAAELRRIVACGRRALEQE
jgi:phosphomannomutase